MDEFDEVTAGVALYACRRCGVVMVAAGVKGHVEGHDGEDAAFAAAVGGPGRSQS